MFGLQNNLRTQLVVIVVDSYLRLTPRLDSMLLNLPGVTSDTFGAVLLGILLRVLLQQGAVKHLGSIIKDRLQEHRNRICGHPS